MSPRVIGILGGMGPEATADLFHKIIKATPAKRDQDHPKVLIYFNPQVPDRTATILGGGEDLLSSLIESARVLHKAGAEFLAIPCITVHHFYNDLQKAVSIPILHMIKETAIYVKDKHPGLNRIGLLATTGTIKAGLLQKEFEPLGIKLILPSPEIQESLVMEAIFGKGGIKKGITDGRPRELVLKAARHLIDLEVEAIIEGCTEIPLVLRDGDIPVPLIDPTRILAKAVVKRAFNVY